MGFRVGDKVVFKEDAYKGNIKFMVPNRLTPIEIGAIDFDDRCFGLIQNASWTTFDKSKLFWVTAKQIELSERRSPFCTFDE